MNTAGVKLGGVIVPDHTRTSSHKRVMIERRAHENAKHPRSLDCIQSVIR